MGEEKNESKRRYVSGKHWWGPLKSRKWIREKWEHDRREMCVKIALLVPPLPWHPKVT